MKKSQCVLWAGKYSISQVLTIINILITVCPEDKGSRFLQAICTYLPNYMASHTG